MLRSDARPLALRVLRTLLDGKPPSELTVSGQRVALTYERLPTPPWPSIEGLNEREHGPWPAPLQVKCTLPSGEETILIRCGYWRTKGAYRHCIGVQVRNTQELVWTTVESILAKVEDGREARITGDFSLRARTGEDEGVNRRQAAALKREVEASGLPIATPWRVELFRLRLPDGSVSPSTEEALRRLILLTLLKRPYLMRLAPEGAADEAEQDVPPDAPSEKRASLYPLPGGVSNYKKTIDELVDWLAEPHSLQEMHQLFKDRFQTTGDTAVRGYINLLRNIGFADLQDDTLNLTALGGEYRATKDARTAFKALQDHFEGVLETLVLIEARGPLKAGPHHEALKALLNVEWDTQNQTDFRRNWLRSLGLTERLPAGDALTPLGRDILREYAGEAAGIRERLADLPIDGAPPDEEDEEEREEIEAAPIDRVDLRTVAVRPHLALSLPAGVLEQACAALSCGKHLLLVGPPGTGKTELAIALGKAAQAEDYCTELRPTTANADWTTFETIGGYALEPVSSGDRLVFRSGVFLRALEQNAWLLVDELNRADVDRAFGELMTVLSGRGAVLPFRDASGGPVSVGPVGLDEPPGGWTHKVRPTFRLIATMNTWDKSSLFKLSYALQRRFAIIQVDIPDDAAYRALIEDEATRQSFDDPLDGAVASQVAALFQRGGILQYRRVGPAVALDIVRYARRRAPEATPGDAVAEALSLFLMPQLEGLDRTSARAAYQIVRSNAHAWMGPSARETLRHAWRDLLMEDPGAEADAQ